VSLLVVVGFSAEAALLPPGTAVLNAAANPEKLAAALAGLRPSAVLSFGIAGGLDPALREAAHERIRLSDLTLPHAMARVLLIEQLYRAWSVNAKHPYHRE
jgi:23S rRNA (pseudouridine1915-N3)-methyltransferase